MKDSLFQASIARTFHVAAVSNLEFVLAQDVRHGTRLERQLFYAQRCLDRVGPHLRDGALNPKLAEAARLDAKLALVDALPLCSTVDQCADIVRVLEQLVHVSSQLSAISVAIFTETGVADPAVLI